MAKGELKRDLILEIGAEEIPSTYFEIALGDLKAKAERAFREAKVSFDSIESFGAPRRVVLLARGLANKQEVEEKTVIGPSKAAAFGENNRPTPALLGFLKAQKADLDDVRIEQTPRGEYAAITKKTGGKRTSAILKEILPSLIRGISFPKSMRWDADVEFVRPVHWILALYGGEKIPFKFGEVRASNVSYGHRFLSPGPVAVKEAKEYFGQLRKKGVIAEQSVRKEMIVEQLRKLAKAKSAAAVDDPQLLESVTYLAEYPSAFCGSFDKSYLSLPGAVLEVSMAKNQRVFGLVDSDGKPLPFFVGVANGKPKKINTVRRNYERVLDAKLKDSAFFYDEDTREPFGAKTPKLSGLIFLKGLGTMDEKARRLARLAGFLCDALVVDAKVKEQALRAAALCKTDLVTEMVKEFPALQGAMGMEYAIKAGEDRAVAKAIQEHYLPRFAGDALPGTHQGAVLAIADKVDLLAGAFGIGIQPTGSWDPYALRRHATGVVRILLDRKYPLSLEEVIEFTIKGFEGKIKLPAAKVIEEVSSFLNERLRAVFGEMEYKQELVDAVVAAGCDNFYEAHRRLGGLAKIERTEDFMRAAKIVQRTANILKGAKEKPGAPEPNAFAEQLERELWQRYGECREGFLEAVRRSQYDVATRLYAQALFDIIHKFFDEIMVNVEDEKVRRNRLAIMAQINELYTAHVADLSKVVIRW